MRIRRATRDDVRGMLEVHRRAVRELGAESYDESTLRAWAPPIDEDRVAEWEEAAFDAEETVVSFLAVEGDETNPTFRGFSTVVSSEGWLRAVYVDPEMTRRGLGTALLRQAEWAAADEGAEQLELDASLNAKEFYLDQGYEVVEQGTVELGDGDQMTCLRMRKELPGPGL